MPHRVPPARRLRPRPGRIEAGRLERQVEARGGERGPAFDRGRGGGDQLLVRSGDHRPAGLVGRPRVEDPADPFVIGVGIGRQDKPPVGAGSGQDDFTNRSRLAPISRTERSTTGRGQR